MQNLNYTRFVRPLALAGFLLVLGGSQVEAQKPEDGRAEKPHSAFNTLPFKTTSMTPVALRPQNVTPAQPNLTKGFNPPKSQAFPGSEPKSMASQQFGSAKTTQNPNAKLQGYSQPSSAKPASFSSPGSTFGSQQTPVQSPSNRNVESSTPRPLAKYLDISPCAVAWIDDIRLPSREAGVIAGLDVREGDFIKAGTTVGRIDDTLLHLTMEQAEMRFEIASERATDKTAKQAASKKHQLARVEANIQRKLAANRSTSETELRLAEYREELAMLEGEKADQEKKLAMMEARLEAARVKEVEAHIAYHVLTSDFDAYVLEIFKKPQEFVNSGDEVMRLARMDRLWVQGLVSFADLNTYEALNRRVTVTVPLARGETAQFEGKIVNVGLERQGGDGYLVKAEIENRPINGHWVLQPLSNNLQMRIHLDDPAVKGGFDAASKPKVQR